MNSLRTQRKSQSTKGSRNSVGLECQAVNWTRPMKRDLKVVGSTPTVSVSYFIEFRTNSIKCLLPFKLYIYNGLTLAGSSLNASPSGCVGFSGLEFVTFLMFESIYSILDRYF